MWIAAICPISIEQGFYTVAWSNILTLASLTASMIVNALVTGLIVFKILMVICEVKSITSNEKSLVVTGGRRFRSIIFIIIESGMALFAIQLARLIIAATGQSTDAERDIFTLTASIHEMLNVVI